MKRSLDTKIRAGLVFILRRLYVGESITVLHLGRGNGPFACLQIVNHTFSPMLNQSYLP